MKLKLTEKLDNSLIKLIIHVEAEELEKATATAYHKNVSKINVPGFRKGKAPRKMIEQMYGRDVFFEDAVNMSYPDAYEKALLESGFEPVSRAEVDIVEVTENDGYTFSATFAVKPEVKIGEYKGLSAEKDKVTVLEKEINGELDRMATKVATTENVTRKIKKGDIVNLNFEGFVDGVAFEGGKADNFDLTIGSGQFIPGFEEGLIGFKTGESTDVEVTFPADYNSEDLKGKPAIFKCSINEVRTVIKPKIDDEFAKDVSEFSSLVDLKADIKTRITNQKEKSADSNFEERLLDSLIETLEADIPQPMIEAQIDRIAEDFSYKIQSQGMSFDKYLEMNGVDMVSFRKLFAEQAERQVKITLALEAVAASENIVISDDEVEAEYTAMATSHGMPIERIKTAISSSSIKQDKLMKKAVEVIVANSKKKAKKAKTEDQ